ncbi:hypothetical protein BH11PLA1_BH11PLA1_10630 [soil metagenome]
MAETAADAEWRLYTDRMTRLGTGFSLGRSTRRCAATGRELAPGDACIAVLVDDESAAGARRLDFCPEAWERATQRPRAMIAFWRTHVSDPGRKERAQLLDDDTLRDLFEQTDPAAGMGSLEGTGDLSGAGADAGSPSGNAERRAALRYVLALMMIRRRLLIVDGSSANVMHIRARGAAKPPEGPPLVDVIDPGVDEATIISVMAELDGDGPGAGSAAAGGAA